MSNFFNEVFITCDTREQSALVPNRKTASAIVPGKFLISDYTEAELVQLAEKRPRIFSVFNHFSRKGAEVGIGKLDRCDYFVTGYHRGFEISLGVEYKQLSDFFGSHEDLPWKLWESQGVYQDVALCVEGRVEVDEHDGYFYVKNNAALDSLRYDLYQARLAEWQQQGVNVRQFDKLDYFAPTLENLVDFVSKSNHKSFEYREPCQAGLVLKMLCQIPGVKLITVQKLLKDNPDMSFGELMGHDLKWMKGKVGKITGEKLWGVLHGE